MKLKTKGVLLSVLFCLGIIYITSMGSISRTTARDLIIEHQEVTTNELTTTHGSSRVPMVIILTYQRCGSSFLGNLFGKNPDAFYVYEPLDSLYTAMYGTAEGWNVPSDITNLPNGQERTLPADEINAVAEFQENLLSCKLENLPIEFLSHKYWRIFQGFQTGLKKYRDCLKNKKISNSCLGSLKGECPFRFGEDPEKETKCGAALWLQEIINDVYPSDNLSKKLQAYKNCSGELYRKTVQYCVPDIKRFCSKATVRAIKTVRGTIKSVYPLLQKYPELKVISLVRDPRSVALSRMKLHSSRGIYSGDNFTKEAQLYCGTVLRDYDVIEVLPKIYSDRIFRVIYDDFVLHPLEYTKKIYDFIGSDLPNITRSFMEDKTRQNKKGWREKMDQSEITNINKVCSEFFKRIPWQWQQLEQH